METGEGNGEWLTYDQIAKARGTAKIGAIRWVQRHRLRRQPGNDGKVRILVDPTMLAQTGPPRRSSQTVTRTVTPDSTPHPRVDMEFHSRALAALEEAVTGLQRRAEEAERRSDAANKRVDTTLALLTEANGRADRAEARASAAEQAAQAAQAAAEALRQAEAARQARGRWARLRAAWRGR